MNICEHCHTNFEPSKGHPNQKYCCHDHKTKALSIKNKLKNAKKCKNCNKNVPYGRKKRTCSEKCEKAWNAIMLKKKRLYNQQYNKANFVQKEPKIVFCDICETKFETTTNRKYCENPDCVKEGKKRVSTIYMRGFRLLKTNEKIKEEELEEADMFIDPKFLKRGTPKTSSNLYNL